jgi:hypothetical protein
MSDIVLGVLATSLSVGAAYLGDPIYMVGAGVGSVLVAVYLLINLDLAAFVRVTALAAVAGGGMRLAYAAGGDYLPSFFATAKTGCSVLCSLIPTV